MSNVRVTVHAGICGFTNEVLAKCEDEPMVSFTIDTPCENIRGLISRLPAEVDAYEELGAGFSGDIHQAAVASLRGCCSACVVPNGIFKAMQVAAGVALPKEVGMEFERVE